jgi:hypothetical protein
MAAMSVDRTGFGFGAARVAFGKSPVEDFASPQRHEGTKEFLQQVAEATETGSRQISPAFPAACSILVLPSCLCDLVVKPPSDCFRLTSYHVSGPDRIFGPHWKVSRGAEACGQLSSRSNCSDPAPFDNFSVTLLGRPRQTVNTVSDRRGLSERRLERAIRADPRRSAKASATSIQPQNRDLNKISFVRVESR